jgi:hypothetical protein
MLVSVACLAARIAIASPPATADPAIKCSSWRVVHSVNTSNTAVVGLSAVSASDIWAAGTYYDSRPPYTVHWDGTAWRYVPQADSVGTLSDAVAIATDDVWAVGYRGPDGLIAEHWDGTAWTAFPVPTEGTGFILNSVDAASSDDVWAVGYTVLPGDTIRGLTEHWDGVSWTIVPDAATTFSEAFYAVSVVGSSDVWAAGWQTNFSGYQPIAEHWDGTAWNVVPVAQPVGSFNQLYGIRAISSIDVWTVGFFGPFARARPLTEHWDGVSWSIVSSPNGPGTSNNFFYDVSGASADDVWAVGQSSYAITGNFKPLMEHWDGSAWTTVPVRFPGISARLVSVDAISSTDIWATGNHTDAGGQLRPLIEHSTGCF